MPSAEDIKQRIEAAIPGARAEVEDYTGGGDHFRATVVRRRVRGSQPHRAAPPRLRRLRRRDRRRDPCPVAEDACHPAVGCRAQLSPQPPSQRSLHASRHQQPDPRRDRRGDRRAPDVILFMKGTPDAPVCGFSARTVAALQSLDAPFAAVDVLPDPRIREELSAISQLADDPPAVRRRRAGGRLRHRDWRCTSRASWRRRSAWRAHPRRRSRWPPRWRRPRDCRSRIASTDDTPRSGRRGPRRGGPRLQ